MPHTLCPGRGVPVGWIWGLFAGNRISPTAVPGVKPLEQWPTGTESAVRSCQWHSQGPFKLRMDPGRPGVWRS
jgi:hypothetical protein